MKITEEMINYWLLGHTDLQSREKEQEYEPHGGSPYPINLEFQNSGGDFKEEIVETVPRYIAETIKDAGLTHGELDFWPQGSPSEPEMTDEEAEAMAKRPVSDVRALEEILCELPVYGDAEVLSKIRDLVVARLRAE